ncbi:sugar nucleotide-binding protein [Brachybacterium sp. UNK5269]|uniref:sugar nucleotide-binding protein n=1 Tax=Brachybacterium sp. UNK5269 TaxID=3408576 RepID=UPI003BB0AFFE
MTAPRPGRTLFVGCGRLGLRVGAALSATGVEVLALRRDPGAVPASFRAVAADLAQPLTDPLPHCESMLITLPPPDAADGYGTPLRHLAQALPARPSRTVYVSSTRVFEGYAGLGDPAPVLTEDDPPRPLSARGRVLVEGERLAEELFGAIVVRPAGIYGPGRDRLPRTVREARPIEHRRRTNRIHEDDLVRVLQSLLLHPEPPRLLHAVDGAPARLGEVVTHIAGRLSLPIPPPVDPDPGHGTVLDGSRMAALLGQLSYPDFRVGYDAMLADPGC